MVLKKFEKYIVSYVLAGSLVQGRATKTSDIDVWVVIDDTDVKRMTRAELKDKLRAIIIGMGIEAGDLTGIQNKLNIIAKESIIIEDGAMLSSRFVTSVTTDTDYVTAASEGNSGNIVLKAPKIVIVDNANVLANADGTHNAGFIHLETV